MNVHQELANGFILRSVGNAELEALLREPHKAVFHEGQLMVPSRSHLSGREKERLKALQQNMGQPWRLNLCAFQGDRLAGWSWGQQHSAEEFYMVNSAVLPEFRRRGLYTELMNAMVMAAREQGFQILYSRHTATNNAVLIPKLKAGFVISSFEISDVFGVLVHLRMYTNPFRRKMMDFRVGQSRPDDELRGALKL